MNRHRETLMKFISAQNQKLQDDISKQGYKDNSPYKNNPFNLIQGQPGQPTSITMKGVSTPLIGMDEYGNKQYMQPGQEYQFPGSQVTETRVAKYGGLLNKTITCSNCGWSWKAADGGNDVSTCHKCGAENKIMQMGGAGMMYADKKYQVGGGKYYTTTGNIVDWGTPEYERAYNAGQVVTEQGVTSPVTLQGGMLDEVSIQNNYKRGFLEKYRDKIVEENKDAGVLGAIIGTPISAITSFPQLAMMKGLTGEMQRPSEAMDIQNPYGAFAVNAITDPTNLIGAGNLTSLGRLTKAQALSKLKNIPTSIAPELREALATQRFPNPVKIIDDVVPMNLQPQAIVMGNNAGGWNSLSPLNWLPGYGKKISSKGELYGYPGESQLFNSSGPLVKKGINPMNSNSPAIGFRKFGNSLQDVIDRQALSPKGSGKFSMGRDQIISEGNWAATGAPDEAYSGVFEATMNPNVIGSKIKEVDMGSTRNGTVYRMIDNNVDIPLTDPGLSFNRRLPFSTRYVKVDKQKLIDGKFQLATQLPHVQSLVEKYASYAGPLAAAGYIANGSEGAKRNVKWLNKNTIDPIIDYIKPQLNSIQYEDGGLTKYQNAGPVKKWLGNTLTPEGYITSTTKGGNRISFTGDVRADDWINKQIDSGKFGFDPTTGGTFPLKKPVKGLSKKDQFIGSRIFDDLHAPQGFTTKSQDAQIEKLPEWQQDIINEVNTKRRKAVVRDQWDEVYKNPLWYAPGVIATGGLGLLGLEAAGAAAAPYITGALATQLPGMAAVPGATVGNAITAGFAGHGLANVGPDAAEMYKNPSWSNAGSLGMDILEIAPIAGPAAKTIGKGLSATSKVENAAIDYANPIKDLAATFKNRNKKLITIGAENLDKELLKKITQLESPEGFNRLVAQEAEMLKRDFPGMVDLENKAISNAQTRISELYQTALQGNFNANYLEAKKLNSALTPQKFGIPRNNAFFRPGLGSSNFSDSVIDLSKANSPAELRNNIFAKEFYGVEMPGEIAIGREYAEGMPVYDHEINHALQNSRNTALDDMLRKYFNNSQNLLKDFSEKTNKAYNYFRKSKHGIPSKEPSSFLAEARRAMLERGLIKDIYEPITPKKVFDAMKHFKTQPYKNPYTEQSYHRIFDFANDSPQTLKFLSDAFNKLPAILPVGLATGATAVGLSKEKQGGTVGKQKKALSWLSS
jgi:hypothetical protein